MAHLSAKHELAKRRRDEMLRERSLALVLRTGYPPECLSAARAASPPAPRAVVALDPTNDARTRSQERVRRAQAQDAERRRHDREAQEERAARAQQLVSDAPALAARRLRERKEKDRQHAEREIDVLISQQTSSIAAMNIARMISPRFEERVTFAPSVPRHSSDEGRVTQLLENDRVGAFYQ
ncbi:hypothetical protein PINS_up014463 [Pythium insidiosum]|nr:hypothetical protein PINS_up014463 [Pythium insidiosum]